MVSMKKRRKASYESSSDNLSPILEETDVSEHNRFESLVTPSEHFARLYISDIKKKKSGIALSYSQKNESIQSLIRKCKMEDDPLQHWLDYIEYLKTENNHYKTKQTPQQQKHLFSVIKRCTFALFYHPTYRNDARFIRVIVTYADLLVDPNKTEALFEYYYRQKIGIQTAVFWISFAFVMEKNFDYKAAKLIYIKALEIGAQPRDLIHQRYEGFQKRVKYYGIDTMTDVVYELLHTSNEKRNRHEASKIVPNETETNPNPNPEMKIAQTKKLNKDDEKKLFEEKQSLASNTRCVLKSSRCKESTANDVSSDGKQLKPVKSKILFSFDIRKLVFDADERCFEECRAQSRYYTLFEDDQEYAKKTNGCINGDDGTTGKCEYNQSLKDNNVTVDIDDYGVRYDAAKTIKIPGTEYVSLYGKSITSALIRMTRRALIESTDCVLTQKVVLNRTDFNLSRMLMKGSTCGVPVNIGNQEILVKNKLGSGAYGIVVSCSTISAPTENIAMKIQKESRSLAWEHEILEKIDRRRRETMSTDETVESPNFPQPLTLTLYSNGATMSMTAASSTGLNMLDIVYAHDGSVPELLAIYYTSRMLKCLESLHLNANILHCDIKADNWVLTSNQMNSVLGSFFGNGSDIMLVDFGRAIDIHNLTDGGLHGNISAKGLECGAMRLNKTWSYDIDCYGVCVCAHTMLHGTYLDIVKEKSTNLWRPRKPFRRYWEAELWRILFETFLNIRTPVNVSDYANSLHAVQAAFDSYLSDKRRISQLMSMLTRQAQILPQKTNSI